jgi:hypothetical protein
MTFILFSPIFSTWFVADDFLLLVSCRDWSLEQWLDFSFNPSAAYYFRPIFKLGVRGLCAVFDTHATAYHVLTVTLHGVNGFLVFTLAQRFFRSRFSPWLAAVLFLFHPAYTWMATWLGALNQPLSVFFTLLALLAVPHGPAGPLWYRHGLALLLLVLALGTNESTALMPGVAAGLVLRSAGVTPRSLIQALPYGGLLVAYLTFRLLIGVDVEETGYHVGAHGFLNSQKYLGILVVPRVYFLGANELGLQLVAAAVVPMLAVWLAFRRGIMEAGLIVLWLAAAIVPPMFFIFVVPRYLYLAGVPFALLVTSAFDVPATDREAPRLTVLKRRGGYSSWDSGYGPIQMPWLVSVRRASVAAFSAVLVLTMMWQMDNIVEMAGNYQRFRMMLERSVPSPLPHGSRLVISFSADIPNPLWGQDIQRSPYPWMVRLLYPEVSRVTFVGPVRELNGLQVVVVPPAASSSTVVTSVDFSAPQAEVEESIRGFYQQEGGFRWMGREAYVQLKGGPTASVLFITGYLPGNLGLVPQIFLVDIEGSETVIEVKSSGAFELRIPFMGRADQDSLLIRIRASRVAIPARIIPGSADQRTLGAVIQMVTVAPAQGPSTPASPSDIRPKR